MILLSALWIFSLDYHESLVYVLYLIARLSCFGSKAFFKCDGIHMMILL